MFLTLEMKKFRAHIKNMYKTNPIVTAFVATHTPLHTQKDIQTNLP